MKIMPNSDFQVQGDAPASTGIVAGTRVATTIGWRPVEEVRPGEKVLTFDGGLQDVTSVESRALWDRAKGCPRALWPLVVPVGALGNQAEMRLLPGQPIMLESDAAEDIFGDPFTLMSAEALEGFRGIRRELPEDGVQVVTLRFATEQVVFANIGALFLCPEDATVGSGARETVQNVYDLLPLDRAMDLTRIIAQDDADARADATV